MPSQVIFAPAFSAPDLPSFISPEQILLALRQLRPSLYREIAVFANDYLFLLLKANYCQPQTTPVKGEP